MVEMLELDFEEEEEEYLIEFDEDIDGHEGNSSAYKGRENHCWWVIESCLEIAEKKKVKQYGIVKFLEKIEGSNK